MARDDGEPPPRRTGAGPVPRVAYTDAEGRATDDPAAAVHGEIVELDLKETSQYGIGMHSVLIGFSGSGK